MTLGSRKLGPRAFADFDWLLLLFALAMASFGVLEIYSAQPDRGAWSRQLFFLCGGVVAMVVMTVIDYHRLAEWKWSIYGFAVALLVAVLIFGREINGAKAWFGVWGFGFQPSELAKLATILTLAAYLAKVGEEKKKARDQYLTLRGITTAAMIVMLPVGLILVEPDQGTALTFFPVLAGMLFVRGVRPKWILTGLLVFVITSSLGWQFRHYFLKTYQLQRIEAVLHPERVDPRGFGYQTMQSTIAVGSGGIWGRGITRGSQSRLKFLPHPDTDFIASVVAEETGFFGMLLVLVLYWLIIRRAMDHARRSPDRLGMLIIVGIVTLIGFHAIINIGMVIGLLPILGIPLLLMSYGGSSIIATFMALGLVASVRYHRHVN